MAHPLDPDRALRVRRGSASGDGTRRVKLQIRTASAVTCVSPRPNIVGNIIVIIKMMRLINITTTVYDLSCTNTTTIYVVVLAAAR